MQIGFAHGATCSSSQPAQRVCASSDAYRSTMHWRWGETRALLSPKGSARDLLGLSMWQARRGLRRARTGLLCHPDNPAVLEVPVAHVLEDVYLERRRDARVGVQAPVVVQIPVAQQALPAVSRVPYSGQASKIRVAARNAKMGSARGPSYNRLHGLMQLRLRPGRSPCKDLAMQLPQLSNHTWPSTHEQTNQARRKGRTRPRGASACL